MSTVRIRSPAFDPLTDPLKTGYGLGVISRHRGSHRRIGHGGMYSGFTAGLWSVAGEDVIVALLLNRGLYFDEYKILDAIVDAILTEIAAR